MNARKPEVKTREVNGRHNIAKPEEANSRNVKQEWKRIMLHARKWIQQKELNILVQSQMPRIATYRGLRTRVGSVAHPSAGQVEQSER